MQIFKVSALSSIAFRFIRCNLQRFWDAFKVHIRRVILCSLIIHYNFSSIVMQTSDWRFNFCFLCYLFAQIGGIFSVISLNTCRLINKFSAKLQTSNSDINTIGSDICQRKWRRMVLFLPTGIAIFHSAFGAIIVSRTIFSQSAFAASIGTKISFTANGLFFIFVIAFEQLVNTMIMEVFCNFQDLNDAIRKLEPESKTNVTKWAQCHVVDRNKIDQLSQKFSTLSIVLQSLEKSFGMFWLFDISQLCLSIVWLLGKLLILKVSGDAQIGVVFQVLSAFFRLLVICLVCGSATEEVFNAFPTRILYIF
jgi:hypothetical protein